MTIPGNMRGVTTGRYKKILKLQTQRNNVLHQIKQTTMQTTGKYPQRKETNIL